MNTRMYAFLAAFTCMVMAANVSAIVKVETFPKIEINLSNNSNIKQYAAVHFLGTESDLSFSKNDKTDVDTNDGYKRCKQGGYNVLGTDCYAKGSGWVPYNRCPTHSNYYRVCQDCTAYPFDKKPDNAASSQCANGMWKIDSCNTGYKLENGSCIYGCNDYPLTSKPANSATVTTCPYDSARMKLVSCNSGYSVNGNTCLCVPSVPSGYQAYNNCEFGLESTKQDHCGQTYYKCKAITTCAQYVSQNLKQYVPISSTETLQHALIDNLDNLVIVNDFTLTADVNLSGKTVFGANDITSTALCANMTTPAITVQSKITTNNNTNLKKLHFKNDSINSRTKPYRPMMIGGGSLSDIEFSEVIRESYDSNYYRPHFVVSGIANLYNVKSNGMRNITVNGNSTLNLKGKLDIIYPKTDGSGEGLGMGGSPTINIEPSGIFSYSGPGECISTDGFAEDGTLGSSSPDAHAKSPTININGTFECKPSRSYGYAISFNTGTVNINKASTIKGKIYASEGATLNINAPTTFEAEEPGVSYKPIAMSYRSNVNINADVKFNNFIVYEYNPKYVTFGYDKSLIETGNLYINADFTSNTNASLVQWLWVSNVTFGPKAYVKGIGRIRLGSDSASGTLNFTAQAGARLQMTGNSCRKASSTQTISSKGKDIIDMFSPRNPPFNSGC